MPECGCGLKFRCPVWADIVEKVLNQGWPKCPPFHVLSECCRSMRSQLGYALHTLLDRKIVRSPKSIFNIGLYGPSKNQTLWKTDFFNNIGRKRKIGFGCIAPHIGRESCVGKLPKADMTHQRAGDQFVVCVQTTSVPPLAPDCRLLLAIYADDRRWPDHHQAAYTPTTFDFHAPDRNPPSGSG